MRIPRAKTPCTFSTKRNKRKSQWGSGGGVVSRALLVLVLDRVSMKLSWLQSKLGGCMSVNTKLLKRLLSVRGVDDPTHT
eukprot:749711-Pelagomonas_calceolata.AAC.1